MPGRGLGREIIWNALGEAEIRNYVRPGGRMEVIWKMNFKVHQKEVGKWMTES